MTSSSEAADDVSLENNNDSGIIASNDDLGLAHLEGTPEEPQVSEPKYKTFGDAKIIADYNEANYNGCQIVVSIGGNSESKNWQPQKLPLAAFVNQLTKHVVGKKDGAAIVLADMIPGRRLKTAVISVQGIGLDIDNGTPEEEIDAQLAAGGFFAVRYTTHSHGKTSTEFKEDAVISWCKSVGLDFEDINTETMRRYVKEKKEWHNAVADTVEYENTLQKSEGVMVIISHAPISKNRIIVPLADPYVIANEGDTQAEALTKWAKYPKALAKLLRLPLDKSCLDAARLYYLGRHAEGCDFSISLFGGPLLQKAQLPLEPDTNAKSTEGKSKSATPEGRALGLWWVYFGHRYQVMTAIEHHAPDRKRGGRDVECAFDENHGNAGNNSDTACFAVDAEGGEDACKVHCMHDSCADKTALDHIGKLVKDGVIPASVLTDPEYNPAFEERDDNIDAETLAEIRKRIDGIGKQPNNQGADDGRSETDPGAAISDGYGGALAFQAKRDQIPKGVSYDQESKTKTIHKTWRNALLLIGHEGWDLGYNELTQRFGMRGKVEYPWPEHLGYALNDALQREIRLYLLRRWGVTFSLEDIYEATMTLARRNNFNPVCDYLAEVEPQWDAVPRVERWLETYMGVVLKDDNLVNGHAAYVSTIGKIVLVAGVRRARQPGCKFDELLTLEGLQGGGKSTAVGILGGEWYSDAKLGDLENTQRVGMKLRGTWIHEFGELAGLNKAEVEEVKDFLSKLFDRYRQPYGRSEDDYLRRCIMIGTVNPGGSAYLTDLTGNRRFWPVVCGEIDLEALARDRDQLWAEAAMMETRGDEIRLDPSLYEVAKAEQDARLAPDPWVAILENFLDGKRREARVLSMTLLSVALELPKERQTQATMRKLKGAMALIPTWEYKTTLRADGGRSAGYEYVGE